mgnify:CR=1 FL=1
MKIGIIGAGNMGFALLRGFANAGLLDTHGFMVSDVDEKKLSRAAELGAKTTRSNQELVQWADLVILAVKPAVVEEVLREVGENLQNKLLISVAAGISTALLEKWTSARVIRMMPNLCAEVGELAACYSLGSRTQEADEKVVQELFGKIGKVWRVDESLMSAVTGLSGSGPAFFFHLLEAAAAAGVELGLPPDLAKELAAQTAKGAAAMVLAGLDPGELVRRVCTPGGTTIEGMKVLEERKAAETLKEAIKAAAKRAEELSR